MSRRRLTSEAGFTLLELVISIAILGLVFVGILGSMGTTVFASDVHRKQAATQVVALGAAERIKSRDLLYVACATAAEPSYVAAARAVPVPAGWDPATTIAITDVAYETRGAGGASFGPTCYDANGIKVQQVTIVVTSPDGRASAQAVVVKNGNV